jgi:uncharacterized membrane protein
MASDPGEPHATVPGTGRIEAFSDGVIAIIITIMVLELKAPAEAFAHGHLDEVVRELGPKLAIYALSYVIVAIMLINHHALIRVAPHASTALYWWNANLLFWMSLIPLSTAVFGEHPLAPLSVAFYGLVLFATAVSFTLLRRCATDLGVRAGRVAAQERVFVRKDMIFTLLYGSSVPLTFLSVYASMAIFVVVPAAYFLPEFRLIRR